MHSDDAYPLVTVVDAAGRRSVGAQSGLASTQVRLLALDDSIDSLVALLRERLRDGGCVGVVRNTVRRAQETVTELVAALDVPVLLAHSRFLAVDRMARESRLRALLGPPSAEAQRPHVLIVVGTQVLEQSLDVDFDLLVTDLTPIDLVLQRVGRMHRHTRPDRPAPLRAATCVVTGCDWEQSPPEPVRGSQAVYGTAKLLRAAGVLHPRWDEGIRLPEDIPALVRAGYDPDVSPGPPGWRPIIEEADAQDRRKTQQSISRATTFRLGEAHGAGSDTIAGWTAEHVGQASDDTEGVAQVRDSEDGIEVVAVQERAGTLYVMPGEHPASGRELPRDSPPEPWLARRLAGYTLRLPMEIARGAHGDDVIVHLEEHSPAAWQESAWLRGQLVLTFDADLRATLGTYDLTYDPDQGLLHTRRENS